VKAAKMIFGKKIVESKTWKETNEFKINSIFAAFNQN